MSVLEGYAQTLCHFDGFHDNLFARIDSEGNVETVAVDWQFLGTGAVGEEIGILVVRGAVPRNQEDELEGLVLREYIEGLRETGWQGTEEEVWDVYWMHSALRLAVVWAQHIPKYLIRAIDAAGTDDEKEALDAFAWIPERSQRFRRYADQTEKLLSHM